MLPHHSAAACHVTPPCHLPYPQVIRWFARSRPHFKAIILRYFNVYGSDPAGRLGGLLGLRWCHYMCTGDEGLRGTRARFQRVRQRSGGRLGALSGVGAAAMHQRERPLPASPLPLRVAREHPGRSLTHKARGYAPPCYCTWMLTSSRPPLA